MKCPGHHFQQGDPADKIEVLVFLQSLPDDD